MAAFFLFIHSNPPPTILYSLFSILYPLFSTLYSLLSIICHYPAGSESMLLCLRPGEERSDDAWSKLNTVLRGSESHVLWYQFTDKRSPLALYSLFSIIYSLNKVLYSLFSILYSLLTKKRTPAIHIESAQLTQTSVFLIKKLFLTNCHCSFFISGFCFAASALGTSSAAPFFSFSNLKV